MLTNFNNSFIAAFSYKLQKELEYRNYHLTSNVLQRYTLQKLNVELCNFEARYSMKM